MFSCGGALPESDVLQPDDCRPARLEDVWRDEEHGRAEVRTRPDGVPPSQPDPRTGGSTLNYPFFYTAQKHMPFMHVGVRCSSVVRAFARGAMGHRIDPPWGRPIELFLVPASAPRLL